VTDLVPVFLSSRKVIIPIKTTMINVDMLNPHFRDQVGKLNGIVIPEEKRPKSAPNDIFVEKRQKKGTREKPDSPRAEMSDFAPRMR
jgi:hypothetical protein